MRRLFLYWLLFHRFCYSSLGSDKAGVFRATFSLHRLWPFFNFISFWSLSGHFLKKILNTLTAFLGLIPSKYSWGYSAWRGTEGAYISILLPSAPFYLKVAGSPLFSMAFNLLSLIKHTQNSSDCSICFSFYRSYRWYRPIMEPFLGLSYIKFTHDGL